MGSSRDIAIGPVVGVSLLLGTLLRDEIGFSDRFLSHVAIVGFMGGVVVTIAFQQLKGLLGSKDLKKKD
ncbi:putative SLC26A/SulP transporter [Helianthus anomalus]